METWCYELTLQAVTSKQTWEFTVVCCSWLLPLFSVLVCVLLVYMSVCMYCMCVYIYTCLYACMWTQDLVYLVYWHCTSATISVEIHHNLLSPAVHTFSLCSFQPQCMRALRHLWWTRWWVTQQKMLCLENTWWWLSRRRTVSITWLSHDCHMMLM